MVVFATRRGVFRSGTRADTDDHFERRHARKTKRLPNGLLDWCGEQRWFGELRCSEWRRLGRSGANGIPTRTALNVTAPATQANLNSLGYVAGGGTAQAQTATLSPAVTSLTAGLNVCWKPTAANTATAPTLAVNGLTATTITKVPGNSPLVPNDLLTSAIACAIYDGTQFELQDPQSNVISATATTNIVSQACNGGVPGTQTLPGGGKCTFVYNDGRYINDATTTLNSSTITCPNSDCAFTAAAVGEYAWVFTSVTVCPISTILTVNNANSVTLAAANDCTSAVTGTGTLWWGHKDTTNLTTAWTANGCETCAWQLSARILLR